MILYPSHLSAWMGAVPTVEKADLISCLIQSFLTFNSAFGLFQILSPKRSVGMSCRLYSRRGACAVTVQYGSEIQKHVPNPVIFNSSWKRGGMTPLPCAEWTKLGLNCAACCSSIQDRNLRTPSRADFDLVQREWILRSPWEWFQSGGRVYQSGRP